MVTVVGTFIQYVVPVYKFEGQGWVYILDEIGQKG